MYTGSTLFIGALDHLSLDRVEFTLILIGGPLIFFSLSLLGVKSPR